MPMLATKKKITITSRREINSADACSRHDGRRSSSANSRTGLTATVRKEKGQGTTLEGGALVLADQGVYCIDEFDKMGANHQALLEVMEGQRVSVAKAGIVGYLPARTTILAADNPSNGHYNRSKTVAENLKIKPAILSRFDLCFLLLDDNRKKAVIDSFAASSENVPAPAEPLRKHLEIRKGEKINTVTHDILRKYIEYYLRRRTSGPQGTTGVVTPRQMDGMLRMIVARAKIDHSCQTTVEHAQDVIELMKHSMTDVLSPDDGNHGNTRDVHSPGTSMAAKCRQFYRELHKAVQKSNNKEF
ncbi:DNA replication licensing factor REC [Sergentomyia squamirostris]